MEQAGCGVEGASFQIVFIEHDLLDCVGRTVVPARIRLIEFDRHNRASADVGASPAPRRGVELEADPKLIVRHSFSSSMSRSAAWTRASTRERAPPTDTYAAFSVQPVRFRVSPTRNGAVVLFVVMFFKRSNE